MSETIRVVIYRQGGQWIAQSLEYDLAAQAKTLNLAMRRWIDTLIDALEHTGQRFGEPLVGIERAPERFHIMFDDAQDDPVTFEPRLDDMPPTTTPPHIAARVLEAA